MKPEGRKPWEKKACQQIELANSLLGGTKLIEQIEKLAKRGRLFMSTTA